ncbi:MAG: ABC transporter ATP-binding protein, partial [Planctomycetota bacterium]
NVLLLDEPTNDLDVETLELLEQRLIEFSGTVLLVSQDREFLNHVVTSTLVFEAQHVREYVGGYDDWLRQRTPSPAAAKPDKPAKSPKPGTKPAPQGRKLSYKETRELEELPVQIESLESEVQALHTAMADTDYYQRSGNEIATDQQRLSDLNAKLQWAYTRWEELESLD